MRETWTEQEEHACRGGGRERERDHRTPAKPKKEPVNITTGPTYTGDRETEWCTHRLFEYGRYEKKHSSEPGREREQVQRSLATKTWTRPTGDVYQRNRNPVLSLIDRKTFHDHCVCSRKRRDSAQCGRRKRYRNKETRIERGRGGGGE